jgi:hypothetical protein
VKRRTLVLLGLVLSGVLCVTAAGYLVAVGARLDTQVDPLSDTETYLTGGALIVGVMGLAMCLGLALRPVVPARGEHRTRPMPPE